MRAPQITEQILPYHDKKTGKPVQGLSGIGLAVKVALHKLRPTVEKHWHPLVSKLMTSCWDDDAKGRPTFSQITIRLQEIISALDELGEPRSASSSAAASRDQQNVRGEGLYRMLKADVKDIKIKEKIVHGADADVGWGWNVLMSVCGDDGSDSLFLFLFLFPSFPFPLSPSLPSTNTQRSTAART